MLYELGPESIRAYGKEQDGISEDRSSKSTEGDSNGGLFFKAATFAFQGGLEAAFAKGMGRLSVAGGCLPAKRLFLQ